MVNHGVHYLMRVVAFFICSVGLMGMTHRDLFEERYGMGILLLHAGQHPVIAFPLFDSIGEDQVHSTWIELPSSSNAEFWTRATELLPFRIFHGGGEPYLVCMEQQGEWFRVRLKGPRDFWVRQEDRTFEWHGEVETYKRFELQKWNEFMAGKAWVGRLNPATNPIRSGASTHSKVINYEYGDCLGPIRTKGWWVEVEPVNGEACITDTTYNEAVFKELFFKKGWVQWRNDSAFLLRTTY